MRRVRLLLIFGIELVVQVYEVVVEIVVQIIVVVFQIVVVQLFVVEVIHVVRPLVLDAVLIVVLQIVLEILVLGVTFCCLLRQPRFRFPLVRETPGGLQHGAHYRNLSWLLDRSALALRLA
jgi:hypothetical protein